MLVLVQIEHYRRRPYQIRESKEKRFFYQLQLLDLRWKARTSRDQKGLDVIKDSGDSLNGDLFDKVILNFEYLTGSRVLLLMADQALFVYLERNSAIRMRRIEFRGGLKGPLNQIQRLGDFYFFFNFEKEETQNPEKAVLGAQNCFYLRWDALYEQTWKARVGHSNGSGGQGGGLAKDRSFRRDSFKEEEPRTREVRTYHWR